MSIGDIWVAKPSKHWPKEKNQRFKFWRQTGPFYNGKYPGECWDSEKQCWGDYVLGIIYEDMKRKATSSEITKLMQVSFDLVSGDIG